MELAYTVMEADKSSIFRVGHQTEDAGKRPCYNSSPKVPCWQNDRILSCFGQLFVFRPSTDYISPTHIIKCLTT